MKESDLINCEASTVYNKNYWLTALNDLYKPISNLMEKCCHDPELILTS